MPDFVHEEEVKLMPGLFLAICENLEFYPKIDLFASKRHHQLPLYYPVEEHDAKALGYNAFAYHWQRSMPLYANPPWSLITEVLAKVQKDKSQILLVTPYWKWAKWYPLLKKLTKDRKKWSQALYLDDQGKLRRAPTWETLFSVVDGEE